MKRDNRVLCPDSKIDFFTENVKERKEAKTLCGICPAKFNCLQQALKQPEYYGVWGGLDENKIRRVLGTNEGGLPTSRATDVTICPFCSNKNLVNRLVRRTKKHDKVRTKCSTCTIEWTRFMFHSREQFDVE